MKNFITLTITVLFFIALIVLASYLVKKYSQKAPENSWAPIYRDPKKEMLAMRGMANESNSVAGMIGNPVIGAMKHKGTLG